MDLGFWGSFWLLRDNFEVETRKKKPPFACFGLRAYKNCQKRNENASIYMYQYVCRENYLIED